VGLTAPVIGTSGTYFFRIATFPANEPQALTLNESVQCFGGTSPRVFALGG
jgi:hypothetical protein